MNRNNQSPSLAMVLEALIFAAETPIDVNHICNIYAEVTGTDIQPVDVEKTTELLNTSFEKEGHAFRIQNWAGGLRMATTASVSPFLHVFFRRERAHRLTRPLMETLAIIAYKQPTIKAEVDGVRGVDSGYSIRKLLSLDLVSIAGRAEVAGRPILYVTTDRFLEEFGLNNLEGLPNLRQVEELLGEVKYDQERMRLLKSTGLVPVNREDQPET